MKVQDLTWEELKNYDKQLKNQIGIVAEEMRRRIFNESKIKPKNELPIKSK